MVPAISAERTTSNLGTKAVDGSTVCPLDERHRITYTVEWSADLQNWNTEGVTYSAPDANGYRTAWFSGADPKCFMRLAVSP